MTTTSNVCAMGIPLFQPEARDVHAEPRAQARGERRDGSQEDGGVLRESQQPERDRDRGPDRERDGEMARDVEGEDGIEEDREEAQQQRSRDEEESAPREHGGTKLPAARHAQRSSSIRAGSSSASFIATRESTASRPSTMRWSYDRAR